MPLDNVASRRAGKDAKTVRESYVKRLRDNYLLILRTLMHDLIVSIDKDGNFVFVNDAAVEFWGKSSKKIIGTHFTEYLHPEDIKKTIVALQDLIENKNHVKGFIVRMKSPRGFRTVAWNGVAVFDEDGDYVGAQATGKDLTDLLCAEEELEQSRSHFRRLFEVMVDPLIIVDMKGNILELSQSAEEILGFPKEELVGKSFLETSIATAESKAIMERNLKNINQGIYVQPHTIEAITKDGKKLLYVLNPARIMYKGEPAILAIFRNITGQKMAEEKLRASEARFRYFMENAPEAIWVQDVNGVFIDGNKRAEELTGYKSEEMIGKNMLEISLVPPEHIPRLMEAFKPNKPGEISGPVELELMRKDGSLVPVEASIIPVERDGKIEIIGITRDITVRKKAEEALRASEKRFRELSDLLPEVIFEMDAKGVLTFVNRIAFDRFGYSREDFDKGLTVFQMLVPEDYERAMNDIGRMLSGETLGATEYTALRKDGSKFPFIAHFSAIMHENKPVGFRGVIVDITERKRAEKELIRLSSAVRMSNDSIVISNLDGTILDVNEATLKMYDTDDKRDLIGKNSFDLIVPEEREKVLASMKELLEKGYLQSREYNITTKDGNKIPVEMSTTIMKDADAKPIGFVAIGRDITERKKAQEAIKAANRLLKQSNEELESYTYVVSHDLKAPLRTIKSFGSFILEDYRDKLDETGQDYLNRMVNASSRMDTMIEDLLILSRVGRKFTEIEKVNLNKLLKEILTDLEATIKEHNAKVVVDKLPVISAQSVWMRQLFTNLISNALKFNESKTPKIEILHQERETDHLFKVRDNGIGIEKKYLERIFNLFERAPTEKPYDGTGAGLSICKKIVEQLGGKIWVESTPGKGSTFMFNIPKGDKKR